MHADPEAIKKSIRSYMIVGALLLVFTAITVAANQLHLAGADGHHGGAHHRDDEGLDGGGGVHAPEPREEVDLRRADADGRVLRRPAVSAVADRLGRHRDAHRTAGRARGSTGEGH